MTLNRSLPVRIPTDRLRSWRPTTLREWPGHIATSLRLEGCAFRCPGCSAITVNERTGRPPAWGEIVSHLETHREMLDGVVVTGGEPTDDPDLPSLLAALKELDVVVRLDTNGSRPDVVAFLLAESLVDSVALDVKTVPQRYSVVSSEPDAPARVMECAQLLRDSRIDHEFRTTVIPGVIDPVELPEIARALQGGRLYAIQQCSPSADWDLKYPDWELSAAAEACRRYLPTIVRGLDIGED